MIRLVEVDESERGGGRLASEVRVFVGRFKSRLLAINHVWALGAVWALLPYVHHSLNIVLESPVFLYC